MWSKHAATCITKTAVLSGFIPYRKMSVFRRFRGMCCLHLQDYQTLFQVDAEPGSKTSKDYDKKKPRTATSVVQTW